MVVLAVLCLVLGLTVVLYGPFRKAVLDSAADAMAGETDGYVSKFELPE